MSHRILVSNESLTEVLANGKTGVEMVSKRNETHQNYEWKQLILVGCRQASESSDSLQHRQDFDIYGNVISTSRWNCLWTDFDYSSNWQICKTLEEVMSKRVSIYSEWYIAPPATSLEVTNICGAVIGLYHYCAFNKWCIYAHAQAECIIYQWC